MVSKFYSIVYAKAEMKKNSITHKKATEFNLLNDKR